MAELMEKELEEIIETALLLQVSDIHFDLINHKIWIDYRRHKKSVKKEERTNTGLLTQLKYLARFNMTQNHVPDSGSFSYAFNRWYYFRFAVIETLNRKHGVLRILNIAELNSLEDCLTSKRAIAAIKKMVASKHGLVLFCGMTGSGKSTTMINALKSVSHRKIFTLENPIEAVVEDFIQLDVGVFESIDLEKTITQLLRHDPDILMIGEIRSKAELSQVFRAALSGHLVTSTLHCASVDHLIYRLEDLGASYLDLLYTLKGLVFQKLENTEKGVRVTCEYYLDKELETLLQSFSSQAKSTHAS